MDQHGAHPDRPRRLAGVASAGEVAGLNSLRGELRPAIYSTPFTLAAVPYRVRQQCISPGCAKSRPEWDICDDVPSKKMANFSQHVGVAISENHVIFGLECYDEIIVIASDGHSSSRSISSIGYF